MPYEIPQVSFAGGMVSPRVYSRLDLQKFGSAVRHLENFFVHSEGGASVRPGTEFVDRKGFSPHVRLVPFIFNENQSYVLEFSSTVIRVYFQGERLTELDSTPLAIPHPYDGDELQDIVFEQSNDVMYLAHPNHAPRKLSRLGLSSWSLEVISFQVKQAFPTGLSIQGADLEEDENRATKIHRYKVTAVNAESGEESLPATQGSGLVVTEHVGNDPVQFRFSGATGNQYYLVGDEVAVQSDRYDDLVGRRFRIESIQGDVITLADSHTRFVGASEVRTTRILATHVQVENVLRAEHTISWEAVDGAESYNIYRQRKGIYGFVGKSENTSYKDEDELPDVLDSPPVIRDPFSSTGNYPGAVSFHEQRSVWGRTNNNPLFVWMSQIGLLENLNVSIPIKDTDAVSLGLSTFRGNEIRHFQSFQDRLFIFTSGGLWSLRPGGNSDAITPASKQVRVEEYLPATRVAPLPVRDTILTVSGQSGQGNEIHSYGYQFENDSYVGSDLTILARNLFEDHTIKDWAYAERPYKLLAVLREDGKVLVMTHFREHNIYAWSIWDFGAEVLSLCSVPEGSEDRFYFVLKRDNFQILERLALYSDHFVDSGLKTVRKVSSSPTSISLMEIGGERRVVVSDSNHGLQDGDKVLFNPDSGSLGGREFFVELHPSLEPHTFLLRGTAEELFEEDPNILTTAYITGYRLIYGLEHLIGQEVVILADGNLLERQVVDSTGRITLQETYFDVLVGLPYSGMIQSLPLNLSLETLDRRKAVNRVLLRTLHSRGVKVGPRLGDLEDYPARTDESWGSPSGDLEAIVEVPISGDWERESGITIQSVEGLPLTLLSMTVDIDVAK